MAYLSPETRRAMLGIIREARNDLKKWREEYEAKVRSIKDLKSVSMISCAPSKQEELNLKKRAEISLSQDGEESVLLPYVCEVVDGQMLARNASVGREISRNFENPLGTFVEQMAGEKQHEFSMVENLKMERYSGGSGLLKQAPLPASTVTSPLPKRPPDPPDMNHGKNRKKGTIFPKYSCEEVYERMEMGLCVFCEELDTPGHYQLKHKRSKIFMTECVDNLVSYDKVVGEAVSEDTVSDDKMSLKQADSVLEIELIPSNSALHGVPATQYQDSNATQQKGPIQATETILVQDLLVLEAVHTEGQMVNLMVENPRFLARKIDIPAFEDLCETSWLFAAHEETNVGVLTMGEQAEVFVKQPKTWQFKFRDTSKRFKQVPTVKFNAEEKESMESVYVKEPANQIAEDSGDDHMEVTTMVKATASNGQEKLIEIGCVSSSRSISNEVELCNTSSGTSIETLNSIGLTLELAQGKLLISGKNIETFSPSEKNISDFIKLLAQSLMQKTIQEKRYKESFILEIYQKRAATESARIVIVGAERRRTNTRLKQVFEAASLQSQILKQSQKAERIWEPGGLPTEAAQCYWPEKRQSLWVSTATSEKMDEHVREPGGLSAKEIQAGMQDHADFNQFLIDTEMFQVKHKWRYKQFAIVSDLELEDETAFDTRNEDVLSCYITSQARDVVVSLHVEVRRTIEMSQVLLLVTDCYGDLTSYGEALYIDFQRYKPVQVMVEEDRNSPKVVQAHKKAVTRCLVQWKEHPPDQVLKLSSLRTRMF